MGDANWLTADLAGIQRLADFAVQRANDLRAISKSLTALGESDDNVFGDTGALDAYRTFLGAWTDELSINAGALDELNRKFSDAAVHYQQTDVHWSHNFQSVAPTVQPGGTQPGVTTAGQPGVSSGSGDLPPTELPPQPTPHTN